MLTRLLWRPWRPARPHAVYYLLGGGTSFFLVLAVTLNQVYYVTVVGLSPLQLVLVGTVLEVTLLPLRDPDRRGRRPLQPPPLGGHRGVALGAGMLLQGLGLLLLVVVLLLVMSEEHFHRTPAAERDTFRHLLGTAREGLSRPPVCATAAGPIPALRRGAGR